MKLIELDCVDSTNEYLKRANLCGDVAVSALSQSGGRGTKGRSFSSQTGGLYISFQREYKNFNACRAFEIMIGGCVAVCRTLEKFGLKPVVRWANDVLVGGKKISGTLIENTLCGGYICRSIVGIGINVCNALPEELHPIATTMRELGAKCTVENVRRELIAEYEKDVSVQDYKSYINWFGKSITLKMPQGEESAVALDVLADGRLLCRTARGEMAVSSAEVSLRL